MRHTVSTGMRHRKETGYSPLCSSSSHDPHMGARRCQLTNLTSDRLFEIDALWSQTRGASNLRLRIVVSSITTQARTAAD